MGLIVVSDDSLALFCGLVYFGWLAVRSWFRLFRLRWRFVLINSVGSSLFITWGLLVLLVVLLDLGLYS